MNLVEDDLRMPVKRRAFSDPVIPGKSVLSGGRNHKGAKFSSPDPVAEKHRQFGNADPDDDWSMHVVDDLTPGPVSNTDAYEDGVVEIEDDDPTVERHEDHGTGHTHPSDGSVAGTIINAIEQAILKADEEFLPHIIHDADDAMKVVYDAIHDKGNSQSGEGATYNIGVGSGKSGGRYDIFDHAGNLTRKGRVQAERQREYLNRTRALPGKFHHDYEDGALGHHGAPGQEISSEMIQKLTGYNPGTGATDPALRRLAYKYEHPGRVDHNKARVFKPHKTVVGVGPPPKGGESMFHSGGVGNVL